VATLTSRTLKRLRDDGYTADVVERWIPGMHVKKDLFGFIDVLAIREGEVLGVQVTSRDHVATRITKITEHDNVAAVRAANIRIEVHGWDKGSNGRWRVRVEDIS